MNIKVLGAGCAKCSKLEKVARQAAEELNLDVSIEKIDDIQKIIEYGILITPGLVVNGKVVLSGQVPKIKVLKDILIQNQYNHEDH